MLRLQDNPPIVWPIAAKLSEVRSAWSVAYCRPRQEKALAADLSKADNPFRTALETIVQASTEAITKSLAETTDRLAQVEHRSAAAYIEQLVERDLRAREEADRVVHIHVAAGLTEVPSGQVTREEGETTERFGRREAVLNALFGGLLFLQNPAHRTEAIKMIAEIDEIPPNIAEAELDSNIVKLSKDGEMQKDWLSRALDMGRLSGMTDLAPVEDIYLTGFKPVPTMV